MISINMNLFLIGYRGTGKSSVGKRLAGRLGLTFVDADRELVDHTGKEIRDIVHAEGWPFFRQLEKEILGRICRREQILCATGGGVVVDDGNIRRMKESGLLVWLQADADTIRDRLRIDPVSDRLRPGLTDQGTNHEIESVLAARTPLYAKAANLAVDTAGIGVDTIVSRIISQLEDLSA